MKRILTLFILLGTLHFASAQLQIDNQLQMTGGSDTDRRITNVGDPMHEKDAVNAGVIQKNALTYAAATGSGGNYVVSLTPAPAAYSTGMIINFKANHSNTGAATLKVGALAAVAIKTGVVNDLSAGNIANSQMVSVMYDGTNFQLLSGSAIPTSLPPSGAAGGDLSGSYPNPDIATGAVTTNEIADATITATDLATTGAGAGTYNNVTVNAQGQVTAGSVVAYLTTETDGSTANEGLLTVGAGGASTSTINSNTSGSSAVTLTAGTGLSISENTGTGTIAFALANTAVTPPGPFNNVTVNQQGQVISGSLISYLTTEVDGSVTNEGSLSVGAGGANSSTVASNTSGSTAVTFAGSGIITVNESGSTITIGAAEVDGSVTNEGSLSVGAGGANSSTILSNTSGSGTISLIAGNGTSITESGNDITISSNSKATFTHWGQATCPATSSLVYSGYAASGAYDQSGSGRNYICLTDDPDYTGTTTPSNTIHQIGVLYGVEFETGASDNNPVSGYTGLNEREALCSVCMVNSASASIMIPGTTQCPTDWTRQYWGYLMSNRWNGNGSDFICMVNNPTSFGNASNSNGALAYAVEIRTGALSGSYAAYNGREVVCSVCTR